MEIEKENEKNVWRLVTQDFSFDLKLLHAGVVRDRDHKPQNTPMDRYVFNYIVRGEGIFKLKDKTYRIKKGDIFIIPPALPYTELNSPDNPYAYYVIAFFGSGCENILARAGLTPDNPVLSVNDPEIERLMKEVFDYCQENTLVSLTNANIAFFNVFLRLFKLNNKNYEPLKKSKHVYVERAQAYIHEHYGEKITTASISTALFVNRTYLCEIFKQITQTSIKEYLINYRISKAMDLLIHSSLSVTKIAELTGFNDYSDFYRCFKARVGYKPLFYRYAYNPIPATPPPKRTNVRKRTTKR